MISYLFVCVCFAVLSFPRADPPGELHNTMYLYYSFQVCYYCPTYEVCKLPPSSSTPVSTLFVTVYANPPNSIQAYSQFFLSQYKVVTLGGLVWHILWVKIVLRMSHSNPSVVWAWWSGVGEKHRYHVSWPIPEPWKWYLKLGGAVAWQPRLSLSLSFSLPPSLRPCCSPV